MIDMINLYLDLSRFLAFYLKITQLKANFDGGIYRLIQGCQTHLVLWATFTYPDSLQAALFLKKFKDATCPGNDLQSS